MEGVNARVAIGHACVCGGNEGDVRMMSEIRELFSDGVLIVQHKRPFHRFLCWAIDKITARQNFSIMGGGVSQKATSVPVTCFLDQSFHVQIIVDAEREDFRHDLAAGF